VRRIRGYYCERSLTSSSSAPFAARGALGFFQLRQDPPEVPPVSRFLAGSRDVVAGLNAQGLDIGSDKFPRGWRVNLYPTGTGHSIVVASAWKPTPWRVVAAGGVAGTELLDMTLNADPEEFVAEQRAHGL
jgi:hypothetical protein